jgi:ferrochelatase
MSNKKAVILFNLGGPGSIKEVKSFLFNLFNDKAIINLPTIFRYLLAKFISSKREKKAIKIYNYIGGKSPILENTNFQAQALERDLKPHGDYKVFTSMRYSKPQSKDTIKEINNYNPEEILLIPLYPQFSTTTTESSLKDFIKNFDSKIKVKMICCYPVEKNFINSYANLIEEKIKTLKLNSFRILFTAHGLPEKIIKKGDPYQSQVELTCKNIIEELNIKNLDYVICYQSKVGPLKWIGPPTESEIIKASNDKKTIIIAPISFVSEHSETLVELDIEYKEVAYINGCLNYIRIEALGINKLFIESLKNQVLHLSSKSDTSNQKTFITNLADKKVCSDNFCKCIFRKGKNYE